MLYGRGLAVIRPRRFTNYYFGCCLTVGLKKKKYPVLKISAAMIRLKN